MFEGSNVALITPFLPDGSLDEGALRKLVQWHETQGTACLVPTGTTGESAVLTHAEHARILQIVAEESATRLPVIAGCGSNNIAEAIELHRMAKELGADAALHVTGYYNRPSQEGIFRHFEALDQVSDLPIIVYNIPPRTIVDIEVDTMVRLSNLKHVVGVKDATTESSRPCLEGLRIKRPFCFLSGEDASAVAYNAAGGHGCISVTANVAPALCAQMQQACMNNDFHLAMSIQSRLMPLHQSLFLEPSPAGVKYACALLGLCKAKTRLPMVELEESTKAKISLAMQSLGLIG